MAKMRANVESYEDAVRFLGGKDARTIGNNTHVVRQENGDISIRLHHTYVVTYVAGTADIVLNSGGWRSVTTKDRINTFLPLRFRVSQRAYVWYVSDRYTGSETEYEDGVILRGEPRGSYVWDADAGEYVFVQEVNA